MGLGPCPAHREQPPNGSVPVDISVTIKRCLTEPRTSRWEVPAQKTDPSLRSCPCEGFLEPSAWAALPPGLGRWEQRERNLDITKTEAHAFYYLKVPINRCCEICFCSP